MFGGCKEWYREIGLTLERNDCMRNWDRQYFPNALSIDWIWFYAPMFRNLHHYAKHCPSPVFVPNDRPSGYWWTGRNAKGLTHDGKVRFRWFEVPDTSKEWNFKVHYFYHCASEQGWTGIVCPVFYKK